MQIGEAEGVAQSLLDQSLKEASTADKNEVRGFKVQVYEVCKMLY